MKNILSTFFALLISTTCFADNLANRTEILDLSLQKQDYETILRTLFPKINKQGGEVSNEENEQDIKWLKSKSEFGHVPLYYFLSWKLIKSDFNESRKWNARARVGIMLDAKECARNNNGAWYAIFEGRAIENNMPLREDDGLWAVSVDEALTYFKNTTNKPLVEWLCGRGNVLEASAAASARSSYWQKIKDGNDKDMPKR